MPTTFSANPEEESEQPPRATMAETKAEVLEHPKKKRVNFYPFKLKKAEKQSAGNKRNKKRSRVTTKKISLIMFGLLLRFSNLKIPIIYKSRFKKSFNTEIQR